MPTSEPALALHPGTLVFAISMFGFLMAGIAFSAAKAMPDQRAALSAWSKAMLGAGGGFMLYYLRGHVPWLLSFVLANMLVIGCAAYCHIAFARVLDYRAWRGLVNGVSAFSVAGLLAVYVFGNDAHFHIAVFSVSGGVAVLLGMTGVQQARHALARHAAGSFFGAAVTLSMAFGFTVRSVVALLGDATTVAPSANSLTQVSALLMGTVFIVVSSVSFFALVHEQQRRVVVEAAARDGLTGVHTRAAFFERAEPLAQPYAVLMVDIDHFKAINDSHGHAAGDTALAHAGRLLAGQVRICDLVGRYGGEEFCILLRDCDGPQAEALARRIVAEAARQTVRLADGRSLSYTVSAGYAFADPGSLLQPAEDLAAVIERADQALYRAKKTGRNRAEAAVPRVALAA